jgi:osmotically-inducible protein OsmY
VYFIDSRHARRRAWLPLEGPVDDAVLVERVRAALGRTIANPHGIEVKAFDGRVVLRGPVTPEELAEIVACTRRVRGVREVDNRLSPHTVR